MKLEVYEKGEYQVISIEEDLTVISELQELSYLVDGYIAQGKRRIAVQFLKASYIYSGAIAVLLQCIKKLTQDDGELCVIENNPDIINIFQTLKLDKVINIYESEDKLPELFGVGP
ncbi:MAG: hypothetical protein GF401_03620 [Chitinivibrionales bacterium]|nr:hypothetical protein [Chitinivibrionales bacterium]